MHKIIREVQVRHARLVLLRVDQIEVGLVLREGLVGEHRVVQVAEFPQTRSHVAQGVQVVLVAGRGAGFAELERLGVEAAAEAELG